MHYVHEPLLQNLIGAARSDNLKAVKYILEYGRNIESDINAREQDNVDDVLAMHIRYWTPCMHNYMLIVVWMDSLDVGYHER